MSAAFIAFITTSALHARVWPEGPFTDYDAVAIKAAASWEQARLISWKLWGCKD